MVAYMDDKQQDVVVDACYAGYADMNAHDDIFMMIGIMLVMLHMLNMNIIILNNHHDPTCKHTSSMNGNPILRIESLPVPAKTRP